MYLLDPVLFECTVLAKSIRKYKKVDVKNGMDIRDGYGILLGHLARAFKTQPNI